MAKISLWTCVFLILLRLAIGWHFFVEGVEKVRNDSWTSEPYLRESSGPLAPTFRSMAGDPLADRLTPRAIPADRSPSEVKPYERFPPALEREWRDYFERFARYYGLTDQQRADAEKNLKQAMDQTAIWLLGQDEDKEGIPVGSKVVVVKAMPGQPAVERRLTVQERLQAYQERLQEARAIQDQKLNFSWQGHGPAEDQFNAELRTARADAARLRNDLRADLDQQTQQMKESLQQVLTDDQRYTYSGKELPEHVRPPVTQWSHLDWADWSVRWGLLAVGLLLLLGLFSRTACVAGAGFLLLFFLAMPPLPGLPENPRAEGHYLFINKNIIEMLALLALATTRSGRWFGLDALVHFLLPRRWRGEPAAPSPRARPAPSEAVLAR